MKLLVGKNHLHLGENMFTLYENPHYLQNTSKFTIAWARSYDGRSNIWLQVKPHFPSLRRLTAYFGIFVRQPTNLA